MSKEQWSMIANFRGGIETYKHYTEIEGNACRDLVNGRLRNGKLESRASMETLYQANNGELIRAIYETSYNGATKTFYVTNQRLYLNGAEVSNTVKGYMKPFRHRDFVYFMNSNSYRKYDLASDSLVDVGLPTIPNDCASVTNLPGPNSFLLNACEAVTNGGDVYIDDYPAGSIGTYAIHTGGTAADIQPFQGTACIKAEPTDVEIIDRHGMRFGTIPVTAGAVAGLADDINIGNGEFIDLPDAQKIGAFMVSTDWALDARSLAYQLTTGGSANNRTKPEKLNKVVSSYEWNYMRINWPADSLQTEQGSLTTGLNSIVILNEGGSESIKEVYEIYYDCFVGHTFMKGGYDSTLINTYKRDTATGATTNAFQDILPIGPLSGEYYYAITAVDEYGLESQAGRIDFKSIREIPKVKQVFDPDNPDANINYDNEDVLVPIACEKNSVVLRVKQPDTGTYKVYGALFQYLQDNPTVEKFRVYRLGGANTEWMYVGDWTTDHIKRNVKSVVFEGTGQDVARFDSQGANLGAGSATIQVRIQALGPPVMYEVSVDNGSTWSTTKYECSNQWAQLFDDGSALGVWIRFNTTVAGAWVAGTTMWTVTVENSGEYPFFDDFEDWELTVIGAWQNNASPADRLSDVVFYDDTNARCYIGYGKYLYYSESNYPDNVPYINFLQFPGDIIAISRDALGILVKTEYNSYRLSGTPGTYSVELVANGVGAISPWGSGIVRGYDFTYTNQRITTIDTTKAFVAKTQAQEIAVGMGLFDYLVTPDDNALVTFDHSKDEVVLVHNGDIYFGQIDALPKVEFSRILGGSGSDKYYSVFFSYDTRRLLIGKQDKVLIYDTTVTSDEISYDDINHIETFTWKSIEQLFGDPQSYKDIKMFWIRYVGTGFSITFTYGPEFDRSTYTISLDDQTTETQVRKRVPVMLRGRNIQITITGKGYVNYFRTDASLLDGDMPKQEEQRR